MQTSSPEVWKRFEEFLRGVAAAEELYDRAAKAGSFIECVCLGASRIDALLRVALVLKHQLDQKTREIPLELVFQDATDAAISERGIYRRAKAAAVIDKTLYDKLSSLYNDRNRVIHRYIISGITTSDVLDIGVRYEDLRLAIHALVHNLEARQIEEKVGISVPGPWLDNEEGRKFLQEFADAKHSPTIAKLLRDS